MTARTEGGSRAAILGRIRQSLGREAIDPAKRAEIKEWLASPPRNPVPARADALDAAARVALFVDMAEAAACTVRRVASPDEIAPAIADYLTRTNQPAQLVQAPALEGTIDWSATPSVEARSGLPGKDDAVGVVPAFAGVAETGTLVTHSGPETPSTLNFLPDTAIAILCRSDIVATYEDAFDRTREGAMEALPRTVNLITGPSRTGDIEQQIQIGVHGPRRLHLVLVDD